MQPQEPTRPKLPIGPPRLGEIATHSHSTMARTYAHALFRVPLAPRAIGQAPPGKVHYARVIREGVTRAFLRRRAKNPPNSRNPYYQPRPAPLPVEYFHRPHRRAPGRERESHRPAAHRRTFAYAALVNPPALPPNFAPFPHSHFSDPAPGVDPTSDKLDDQLSLTPPCAPSSDAEIFPVAPAQHCQNHPSPPWQPWQPWHSCLTRPVLPIAFASCLLPAASRLFPAAFLATSQPKSPQTHQYQTHSPPRPGLRPRS